MLIKDLCRKFYSAYCLVNLKPSTCNGYRVNIENHIIPNVGKIDADKLTVDDVDELVEVLMGKGLSRRSVRYVFAVLRKAFEFGLKRGYVQRNIITVCDAPVPARYNHVVWSDEEVARALSCVRSWNFEPDYVLPAVLLSLHYGLRRGEVLGLKWSDFSKGSFKVCRTLTYINNRFMVTTPKNGKFRSIMLSNDDYEFLCEFHYNKQPNKDGYLIRTSEGTSPTHLNVAFKKFIRQNKLTDIRYHDLRHTYATYMLRHGVHPKIVSSVLGHSSIDITLDLYSHADISMQKACLEVFGG